MMLEDFSDRAQECVRFSEQSDCKQDRELFLALARAWYGLYGPHERVNGARHDPRTNL